MSESTYYESQETIAKTFGWLSGLPFQYLYTGGGCDAIYAHDNRHRVYITDDASVPHANDPHYLGVYSRTNDELVGEFFTNNRAELLQYIYDNKLITLRKLVNHMIKLQPYALGGE